MSSKIRNPKSEIRNNSKFSNTRNVLNFGHLYSFRVSNFEIRVYSHGFSLIELLIAVALTATVGFVISTSFFNIMRGATKAEIIKEVKQNGEYALAIIERSVRGSQAIVSACDGLQRDSLTVQQFGGATMTFSCIFDSGAARIATQSAGVTNYLTSDTVSLGQSCPGSLQFTCTGSTDGSTTVAISYTLQQKNVDATVRDRASASFQTAITLRN